MRGIVGRAKRGVKRSVLTDGRGVPVAGVLDGANRVGPRGSPDNDHTLMRETLDAVALPCPSPFGDPSAKQPVAEPPEGTMPGRPQHLCLDKGYDDAEPREIAAEFGFTLHPRTHGEEVAAKRHADARARCWIIERTLRAQPLPRRPDPLEQGPRRWPRPAPLRLRHHWLATCHTGISFLAELDRLACVVDVSDQDHEAAGCWIEGQADRAEGRRILAALPRLGRGGGWVRAPSDGVLAQVAFPRIQTFDSSSTPGRGEQVSTPRPLGELDLSAIATALAGGNSGTTDGRTDHPLRQQVLQLEMQLRQRDRELAVALQKRAE